MTAANLHGKVVLVTGAAGRAGRAVCETLHLAGAELVVLGRDQARLDALADQFEPRAQTVVADLRDAAVARDVVGAIVTGHGRLDGVVHLVGGWAAGGVETFDPAVAERLYHDLAGTTANIATAARTALISSGGRFVTVGSVAVDRPEAQNAAYAAAKGAAEHWVMALADSFNGTDASAYVLRVRALLTPQMQQRNPDRDYTGWTRVDQLAQAVLRNWNLPHTNGIRIIA